MTNPPQDGGIGERISILEAEINVLTFAVATLLRRLHSIDDRLAGAMRKALDDIDDGADVAIMGAGDAAPVAAHVAMAAKARFIRALSKIQ